MTAGSLNSGAWMWILGSPAVEHNKQADPEIPDVSTSFCLRLLDLPGAHVGKVDGTLCPLHVGKTILTLWCCQKFNPGSPRAGRSHRARASACTASGSRQNRKYI